MSITHSIRKWAFRNARLAQGLIVLSTIILFFLGHVIGVLADEMGWDTYAMFLLGTGTAILAWTLAPRRGEDFPIRYTYSRQKVAVIIMLFSTCIGIGGGAICLEKIVDHTPPTQLTNFQAEAVVGFNFSKRSSSLKSVDVALSSWFKGGISKQTTTGIRSFLKKIKPKKKSLVGMILATVGCLLITYFLVGGVFILSCSLSCNGYEALSAAVLIGGLTLIIIGLVKILGMIYRNPDKGDKKKRKPVNQLPDT